MATRDDIDAIFTQLDTDGYGFEQNETVRRLCYAMADKIDGLQQMIADAVAANVAAPKSAPKAAPAPTV